MHYVMHYVMHLHVRLVLEQVGARLDEHLRDTGLQSTLHGVEV